MGTKASWLKWKLEMRPCNAAVAATAGAVSRVGKWYAVLRSILPIYLATHLAFLCLTYFVLLFISGNTSSKYSSIYGFLHIWDHWDSAHFVLIATQGYRPWWEAAFFPLYPLLERGGAFFTHDPFIAGLIISNLAGLCMLAVLYRLVAEDFDQEHARRSVLYLSVFPTAFFFAAAYNESIFLCFVLLSFYHMRHGHWWLAGLFGFLASLTRSAGLLLLLPFCYEYLNQHDFKLKNSRLDVVSGLLIPAGIGVFALYCAVQLHDPLAFSHAQRIWGRSLRFPWHGIKDALTTLFSHNIVSFESIHTLIDLGATLLMLLLLVLCFVGPWKFPKSLWAYPIYATGLYLFLLLFPINGPFPLQSLSRLVLELFPAFIVLAAIGKRQQFHLYYLMLSVPLLSFMLLQFLAGHWIV